MWTKTIKITTPLCLCVSGVWVFYVGFSFLRDDEKSEATLLLPQIFGAVMSTGSTRFGLFIVTESVVPSRFCKTANVRNCECLSKKASIWIEKTSANKRKQRFKQWRNPQKQVAAHPAVAVPFVTGCIHLHTTIFDRCRENYEHHTQNRRCQGHAGDETINRQRSTLRPRQMFCGTFKFRKTPGVFFP